MHPGIEMDRELVVCVLFAALLAGACVAAPIAAAFYVSPWIGMALSGASFWVWSRVGPPPMPGFLTGTLCIWGYMSIFGSLVTCVMLAFREM